MYADDSAILVSGTDPNAISNILSKELNSCKNWLTDNKLDISSHQLQESDIMLESASCHILIKIYEAVVFGIYSIS